MLAKAFKFVIIFPVTQITLYLPSGGRNGSGGIKMILALDIGNTNICIGAMEGTRILKFARILSRRQATGTEYLLQLRSVLGKAGLKGSDFEGSIITSVVPQLTGLLADTCQEICGKEPLLVSHEMNTGFGFAIDQPQLVGRDRLVDLAAALELYGQPDTPVVTIDLGTATTLSVLDGQRMFRGGLIIPGVQTSLTALASRAAQLPPIPLDEPRQLLGETPIDCMNTGIVNGTAAMLDGLMERISAQMGREPVCVMTGGLSKFILPCCKHKYIYDQDLLLKGLAILYSKNS